MYAKSKLLKALDSLQRKSDAQFAKDCRTIAKALDRAADIHVPVDIDNKDHHKLIIDAIKSGKMTLTPVVKDAKECENCGKTIEKPRSGSLCEKCFREKKQDENQK